MKDPNEQRDEPNEAEQEHPVTELRDYVPADILDVSFPQAVRGYDRRSVDEYVKRVNRLIAEIKVTASPRAAVKHALQQTEQQVAGLLERARETADEITTSAHQEAESEADGIRAKAAQLLVNTNAEAEALKAEAENTLTNARTEAEDILVRARLDAENTVSRAQDEADQRLQQLQAELASLQEQAEARMEEIQDDTAAVLDQRRELFEDIRETASSLVELADAATEPDLVEALEPKGESAAVAVEADGE